MIISPRLIMYSVLAASIASGALYIKHVFNERDRLKIELKESNLTRDTAISSAFLYRENNERQAKQIKEYQVELDEKNKYTNNLERDIAANRKRLSIRATCSPSSSATANSSTASTATIDDPSARLTYFNLRRGIEILESNYALCLNILNEDRKKAAIK